MSTRQKVNRLIDEGEEEVRRMASLARIGYALMAIAYAVEGLGFASQSLGLLHASLFILLVGVLVLASHARHARDGPDRRRFLIAAWISTLHPVLYFALLFNWSSEGFDAAAMSVLWMFTGLKDVFVLDKTRARRQGDVLVQNIIVPAAAFSAIGAMLLTKDVADAPFPNPGMAHVLFVLHAIMLSGGAIRSLVPENTAEASRLGASERDGDKRFG